MNTSKGIGRIRPTNDQLTDQLFNLRDENHELKKKLSGNDEKTKQLLVKIQKLTKELNQEKNPTRNSQFTSVKDERETLELMSDLREQLRKVSTENSSLKNKVQFFKTLHEAEARKRTPYSHIPPRVNAGVKPKLVKGEDMNRNLRSAQTFDNDETVSELQELIQQLRSKLTAVEHDNLEKQQLALKLEKEKEETEKQHSVDLLALQHENYALKKRLVELKTNQDDVEENHRALTKMYKELVDTSENMSNDLQDERNKNLELIDQLEKAKADSQAHEELKVIIDDLTKEKQLLQEELHKMVGLKFGSSREEEFLLQISTLKNRIAELQDSSATYLKERLDLFEQIERLKETLDILESKIRTSDAEQYEMQNQLEQLKSRFKAFLPLSDIEIDEAFALWKLKVHSGVTMEVLENFDSISNKKEKYKELKRQFAECAQDLEKTRHLLKLQEDINVGYRLEIKQINEKMKLIQNEYEFRLEELSKLADLRGHKIQQLENQLRQNFSFPLESKTIEAEISPPKILNGENTIVVKISSAIISEEAIVKLALESESLLETLLAVEFYDFETIVSPIGFGRHPNYNFEVAYTVTVDDFLLEQLRNRCVQIALVKSTGMHFQQVGHSNISLVELLENRLSKTYIVDIVGNENITVGKLECSISLEISMPLAIEAFHERTLALNLLDNNTLTSNGKPLTKNLLNNLNIMISSASFLKQLKNDSLPNIYGVILCEELFRDIVIPPLKGSYSPDFGFSFVVPLHMNSDTDRIIRTSKITIIFIDEDEDFVYGFAKIPLHKLGTGQSITEQVTVEDSKGLSCGYLNISLSWDSKYEVDQLKVISIMDNNIIESEIKKDSFIPEEKPLSVIESDNTSSERKQSYPADTIDKFEITLKSLDLNLQNETVIKAFENIKQIYICYDFLTFPQETLETNSIPVQSGPINICFKRQFLITEIESLENSSVLRDMRLLVFTLVDEPAAEDKTNPGCTDIGIATVEMEKLVDGSIDLTVYSLDKSMELGCLNIEILGSDAISKIIKK